MYAIKGGRILQVMEQCLGCEIWNDDLNMNLEENIVKYNKLNQRIKRDFWRSLRIE
jgi:hypothetical protein